MLDMPATLIEAGLISVLGRKITVSVLGGKISGISEGVGTEGLKGNVDGCKGSDGGQRLEGKEG